MLKGILQEVRSTYTSNGSSIYIKQTRRIKRRVRISKFDRTRFVFEGLVTILNAYQMTFRHFLDWPWLLGRQTEKGSHEGAAIGCHERRRMVWYNSKVCPCQCARWLTGCLTKHECFRGLMKYAYLSTKSMILLPPFECWTPLNTSRKQW